MRKTTALVALLALGGCASSPEYVASRSNWDVCRLTMGGPHSRNAEIEAQRRGLDCAPLYQAISADQARRAAATQMLLQQRPAPRAPTMTNCTSRVIGDTVQTNCH